MPNESIIIPTLSLVWWAPGPLLRGLLGVNRRDLAGQLAKGAGEWDWGPCPAEGSWGPIGESFPPPCPETPNCIPGASACSEAQVLWKCIHSCPQVPQTDKGWQGGCLHMLVNLLKELPKAEEAGLPCAESMLVLLLCVLNNYVFNNSFY